MKTPVKDNLGGKGRTVYFWAPGNVGGGGRKREKEKRERNSKNHSLGQSREIISTMQRGLERKRKKGGEGGGHSCT